MNPGTDSAADVSDDDFDDLDGYQPKPVKPAGRGPAWLLIVGGFIAFVASFDLTIEKIKQIADPDHYKASCSISPLLDCGGVMNKAQASVFGFANSLLGITGWAVVITIGVAILAGAVFAKWFWMGLQAGVILGMVFILWLMSQSIFSIGVLCPYCMVVWTVMIPVFVYVSAYNIRARTSNRETVLGDFMDLFDKYKLVIVVLVYATVITIILIRFWSYWATVAPFNWVF